MTDTYLRDVLTLPESVHAGDFKVELTGGFTEAATVERVREYVVTDQLRRAFREALSVVRSGAARRHLARRLPARLVRLRQEPLPDRAARRAQRQPGGAGQARPAAGDRRARRVAARQAVPRWCPTTSSAPPTSTPRSSAATWRTCAAREPEASIPAVYRSDAMLDDARRQREFLADDAAFARWLGADGPRADPDDLDVIDGASAGWSTAELDAAFAAPPGSAPRRALESALLSGPMSSYARGAHGDADAFVPLENGLAVIAEHARSLGYDGLILFLDELILWLQAHMSNQEFVNTQVSKLVKLIESGVAERALPIVSFISRQRDLSKLVGEDVTGADVKNLEAQVEYLAGRFDVVNLEDTNLPAIVARAGAAAAAGQGGAARRRRSPSIESSRPGDRDVLLDATGATGATWDDFRRVYPLSPALLNVLVALSGALQRERTGLKLLQEMLYRRRDDMKLGELIPLGDLWDVLADGTGEAFTDRLRREADAAHRFYARARAYLVERYGGDDLARLRRRRPVRQDAPARLARPAAARAGPAHRRADRRAQPRLDPLAHRRAGPDGGHPAAGAAGRVRRAALRGRPGPGVHAAPRRPRRRAAARRRRGEGLAGRAPDLGQGPGLGARSGSRDSGEFVSRREFVWRGTRRTAEFVFANVRDQADVPDLQFTPEMPGNVRFVLDYPFDPGFSPADDVLRVTRLRRAGVEAATVVWIPLHLTEQRSAQLGRLLKIDYLLERDRLEEYAADLSADLRLRMRQQLLVLRENLSSQLRAALAQAYGIARPDPGTVRADLDDGMTLQSLLPDFEPRLAGGASFEQNAQLLVDGLFATLHPRHPDFDPARTGRAITLADLRTTLGWITKAMETGERRTVVEAKQLPVVRRIVHGLELGEVGDGPLTLSVDWRRRIDQQAAVHGVTGDLPSRTCAAGSARWARPGWTVR